MRLLYIALEYCEADLFSGNGICSRSQVRGLAETSQVHVICGRPQNANDAEPHAHNITISTVPLEIWFTTDRKSAHEAFASGASRLLDELNWKSIDACIAVDWTGMNAILMMSSDSSVSMRRQRVPVMYLSFRSYVSMTNISEDDREFYRIAEGNAVRRAVASGGGVVALCDDDWHTLKNFTDDADAIRVIFPMLRAEFSSIAVRDRGKILDFGRKRSFLVSLVRLSEDKGAHRFVQLVCDIQAEDPTFWDRTRVVPLLCGAASQPEYAEQVKREFCDAVPGVVVIDRFLTPEEMAEVLQNAVLNVHAALYEAYGLTIVEAAAMGCPSVIHCDGIGAAQLLRPVDGAVEALDISNRMVLAGRVKKLLEDDTERVDLAYRAYQKATSWGEQEYVAMLEDFIKERINSCRRSKVQTSIIQ